MNGWRLKESMVRSWRPHLIALMVLLLIYGCSSVPKERAPESARKGTGKPYKVYGKSYYPLLSSHGFKQTGTASWYGDDFHGKTTSNGEKYNMYAATAAHKTLPFGTIVQVTNLENGKQTLARINDRGPFVKNRIIDLSWQGADNLGILDKGTALVKIEALGKEVKVVEDGKVTVRIEQPSSYDVGDFTVQVGSFLLPENASRLRDILAREYDNAHVVTYDSGSEMYYRVRVTQASSLQTATKNLERLERAGYKDAFVVAN